MHNRTLALPIAGASHRRLGRCAALLLCLAMLGCGDAAAPLMEQLRTGDADARRAAAARLGTLGPRAADATPALLTALSDSDAGVRRAARTALGQIGPAAQAAVPALKAELSSRDLAVRLGAARALQRIDPAGRAYVPALVQAMRSGEGGTIVAVGEMGGAADWAIDALTALLNDQRPGIRRIAAEALGRIAADKPASVPAATREALRKRLNDGDEGVRRSAAAALAAIEAAGAN